MKTIKGLCLLACCLINYSSWAKNTPFFDCSTPNLQQSSVIALDSVRAFRPISNDLNENVWVLDHYRVTINHHQAVNVSVIINGEVAARRSSDSDIRYRLNAYAYESAFTQPYKLLVLENVQLDDGGSEVDSYDIYTIRNDSIVSEYRIQVQDIYYHDGESEFFRLANNNDATKFISFFISGKSLIARLNKALLGEGWENRLDHVTQDNDYVQDSDYVYLCRPLIK